MLKKAIQNLSFFRYQLLGLLLLGIALKFAVKGQWSGDFYEHAAVIKELATNPLDPKNPIILSEAPHAFFSPYSLLLGLTSRTFSIDPIKTLSIASVLNLILFLGSLRLFIFNYYKKNQQVICFYALLLILFFWGKNPWWYSGFFHFDVLFYVLPYPSTFAIALGFLSLALCLKRLNPYRAFFIVILSAIAFISHPISILPFYIILFFLSIKKNMSTKERAIRVFLIIVSFTTSIAWPYYSLVGIFTNSSQAIGHFNSDTISLYRDLISPLIPFIFVFPPIVVRKFNENKILIICLIIFSSIYIFGFISKIWGLGRIISITAIILQIILSTHFAAFENWICKTGSKITISFFCITLTLGLVKKFYLPLRNSNPEKATYYSRFKFLESSTEQYDVILSDIETSFYVPAFGGKVIASPHPLYFIEDHQERTDDLKTFYNPASPLRERRRIIDLYSVKYILLNRNINGYLKNEIDFKRLGKQIYKDRNFSLIKIDNSK